MTLSYTFHATARKYPMLNSVRIERPADTRFALLAILFAGFTLRTAAALIVPDQSANLPDAIFYREAGKLLWATLPHRKMSAYDGRLNHHAKRTRRYSALPTGASYWIESIGLENNGRTTAESNAVQLGFTVFDAAS
jgi:hypothetical protein